MEGARKGNPRVLTRIANRKHTRSLGSWGIDVWVARFGVTGTRFRMTANRFFARGYDSLGGLGSLAAAGSSTGGRAKRKGGQPVWNGY